MTPYCKYCGEDLDVMLCQKCSERENYTCGDCIHFRSSQLCSKHRFTKGKNDPENDCFDFERENMKDIKITAKVDGKQVPLENISTETFEAIKALEKSKEIPVARLATLCGRRKLIFKVTRQMAERKDQYVAVGLDNGHVTGYWSGSDDSDCGSGYGYNYKNIQPL